MTERSPGYDVATLDEAFAALIQQAESTEPKSKRSTLKSYLDKNARKLSRFITKGYTATELAEMLVPILAARGITVEVDTVAKALRSKLQKRTSTRAQAVEPKVNAATPSAGHQPSEPQAGTAQK